MFARLHWFTSIPLYGYPTTCQIWAYAFSRIEWWSADKLDGLVGFHFKQTTFKQKPPFISNPFEVDFGGV